MSDEAKDDRQSRSRFRLILLYLLLISPWVASGAMSALETTSNSPLDWVDTTFGPRRDYDRFTEQFGAGDVVVVSWPDCVVGDARLDQFMISLRESPGFFDGEDWLFHRVTSGREVLQQFTSPPISLPMTEAKQRIGVSLLGQNGETTAVVIGFNEAGLRQRNRLVPLIRAAAVRHAGAPLDSLHLAGPSLMDMKST